MYKYIFISPFSILLFNHGGIPRNLYTQQTFSYTSITVIDEMSNYFLIYIYSHITDIISFTHHSNIEFFYLAQLSQSLPWIKIHWLNLKNIYVYRTAFFSSCKCLELSYFPCYFFYFSKPLSCTFLPIIFLHM